MLGLMGMDLGSLIDPVAAEEIAGAGAGDLGLSAMIDSVLSGIAYDASDADEHEHEADGGGDRSEMASAATATAIASSSRSSGTVRDCEAKKSGDASDSPRVLVSGVVSRTAGAHADDDDDEEDEDTDKVDVPMEFVCPIGLFVI